MVFGILVTLFIPEISEYRLFAFAGLLIPIITLFLIFNDRFLNLISSFKLLNFMTPIFKGIRGISKRESIIVVLQTTLIWAFSFIPAYYTYLAIGWDISIWIVVVVMTLTTLSVAIPIQPPGLVGTFEGFNLLTLKAFNITTKFALEKILLVHAISLVTGGIVGLLGIIYLMVGELRNLLGSSSESLDKQAN
jgi:uncharacterized membrane protein YbhN (UPF0104 family)